MCALRRIGLHDAEFAQATCGTIRLKLLKIGALVRVSVRRIKVAMPSAAPLPEIGVAPPSDWQSPRWHAPRQHDTRRRGAMRLAGATHSHACRAVAAKNPLTRTENARRCEKSALARQAAVNYLLCEFDRRLFCELGCVGREYLSLSLVAAVLNNRNEDKPLPRPPRRCVFRRMKSSGKAPWA
jgi:Transposase DDE domain group 1